MGTKKRKCFNLVAVGLALASGLVLTGANGTVASADSVKTGYKSSDDYLVQHGIYTLGATDATIEVGSVNATSILSATHAIATNVLASEIPMQSPNIQVILKQSNVKDVPGQYKVTLGIAEDPELEKTVTITVVDEKKDVGQNGIYSLTANDVVFSIGQANEQTIIAQSGAQAKTTAGIPLEIIIKKSDVKSSEVGDYKVVLGINEDPTISITINVKIVGTEGEKPSTKVIRAYDAVVEAGHIDDNLILSSANAAVINPVTGMEVIETPVYIKSSTVEDKAGVYSVVLGAKGDSSVPEKTIQVTVLGNSSGGGETNPDTPIPSPWMIRAYDATVETGQIDDNSILSAANAMVINAVTGMTIDTPYIKSSTIEDKPGTYTVVLDAKGGYSSVPDKTIQVTVLGNSSEGGETNPDTPIPSPWMIRAYDATVETGQIDDNSILSAANAMVINAVTGMTIDTPYIKSSTIEDKPGTYTVVLDAKGGYSSVPDKTIQVTVLGNSSEGGETNPDTPIPSPWMIRAYDATVETGQIDDNSILSAANAMVINAVTGMTIDTPYIKSSTIEDKPGTYTVVLDAKGGYSSVPDKTIQVTVLGNSSEGGETNPDTPIPSPWMIRAYDATVETGQIDDNSILSAANAMVINAVTGMTIDTPYIKSSTIEDKPGTYTVVLDAKGGYSSVPDKTIQVTVLGNSSEGGETNPDTPIPSPWMIRAYDATVETGQIDDNSILSAANAMVINAVTGMTIDTPYIKSSTIEDKPGTYTVVLDAKGGYSSVPDKTIQVTVLGNSGRSGGAHQLPNEIF